MVERCDLPFELVNESFRTIQKMLQEEVGLLGHEGLPLVHCALPKSLVHEPPLELELLPVLCEGHEVFKPATGGMLATSDGRESEWRVAHRSDAIVRWGRSEYKAPRLCKRSMTASEVVKNTKGVLNSRMYIMSPIL